MIYMVQLFDLPNDIEPCPFCGGLDLLGGNSGGACSVYCEYCKSDGPRKNTSQEAIDAWNESKHQC